MMKTLFTSALLAAAVMAAAPAQAAFTVYPTPGAQNPVTYTATAANNGLLRTFFVSKEAAYTSKLGVFVNGVNRGFGLNNATASFGQMYNFGAVNAGDTIEYYIFVTNTNQTFRMNSALNPHKFKHFWRSAYSGTDFGGTVTGDYYSVEDIKGGGDRDYNDFAFVSTTAPVPEPATWAMMILGFGLIGGALRSSRRGQTAGVRYA